MANISNNMRRDFDSLVVGMAQSYQEAFLHADAAEDYIASGHMDRPQDDIGRLDKKRVQQVLMKHIDLTMALRDNAEEIVKWWRDYGASTIDIEKKLKRIAK